MLLRLLEDLLQEALPGGHLGCGRERLAHPRGPGLRSLPGAARDRVGDDPQRDVACRAERHEHGAGEVAGPGWRPHPGGVPDDIVQHVILELHAAISRGHPPENLRAWSRAVARRLAWQMMRHRPVELSLSADDIIALGGFADAEDKIAMMLERHEALRWIRTLPEPEQAVIALTMDGYSRQEIARELGISNHLVRIRLAAGREKLRQVAIAQIRADASASAAGRTARAWRAVRPAAQQLPSGEPADETSTLHALNGLPPRQQEVLQLSRRGYKPTQIARVLGLSPNTVRVNLCHARKRMRLSLELLRIQEGRAAVPLTLNKRRRGRRRPW